MHYATKGSHKDSYTNMCDYTVCVCVGGGAKSSEELRSFVI